ncbi:MAG: RNA methyltransferase [Coriobacteriales bacterium]|jgi:23S rRNA (guanosine2251-2'-O)-methyltransferase|nr:RNA methyltransferase [Coriobacteriales bacterium]
MSKGGWREQTKDFNLKPFKYNYATLADIIGAGKNDAHALVLVLDHITDVGNFGAIVRSAEVVGVTGIVIPNARSVQVNEAVFRTSAGAIEHVRVAREANIADSLRRLKSAGFWVAGATEHASELIWDAPLDGQLAIVLGSEETGLSRLTRELCDFEFKLPQRGQTQSLNVAQAATAILYECLRRMN